MSARFVVVGASLAGLRAVETARRLGHTGPITLVGAEHHLPYDRPPLSKSFLNEKEPGELPAFRSREHLEDELGVDLVLDSPADGLDVNARLVHVGDREVPYDRLVVATGAAARNLPDGEGLSGVYALRTLDDAKAVRDALDAGKRTVVVGAGFIGSEVASAARKRGLDVTVVEAASVPLSRSVGGETGAVCADLHRRNGTALHLGVGVDRLEAQDGSVRGVVLEDGTVLPADLVVVGVGVEPATGWLGESLALHEGDGGVLCDSFLRTSAEHVFAAGDVAHWPHPLFDNDLLRLEHWTSAAEHGTAAATSALAPEKAASVANVPYFWSDWYDHRIQFVGVPRAEQVLVVDDGTQDDRFLALYRRGDRLVGTLTIDRPAQIMKFRRLIGQRDSWTAGLEMANHFVT